MRTQSSRGLPGSGGADSGPIPVDGRSPHERLLTLATAVVVVVAALLVWVVTFTPVWGDDAPVVPAPEVRPVAREAGR